ncbi:hypothetical protein FQA39_LY18999 [Lamprigera yunnana]|nr:hypothetical protein FQA39_LY18999 [Lamprigera yunnana]
MNRKISANLQAKAIKEINEVPNRIEEDVKQIREWLSKEQHLKVQFAYLASLYGLDVEIASSEITLLLIVNISEFWKFFTIVEGENAEW